MFSIRIPKKTLYIALGVLGFLLLVGLSILIFFNISKRLNPPSPPTTPTPTPSFDVYAPYNVLILGYGGAGHDGGSLSDSIMVAHIAPRDKKVVFIFIPRDTWVEIPVRSDKSEKFKINSAWAIGLSDTLYPLKEPIYKGEEGPGNLAKKVVEEVIGMPIGYYVAIDFDGFKNAIDAIGGIEVNSPTSWDDYFYPVKGRENETCGISEAEIASFHAKYSGFDLEKQFECRYEHIHFDQGLNKLDGEMALKFVRSRHSETYGGDFARGEKQQVVLMGIIKRLISLDVVKKIDPFFDQFSKIVRTDINLQTAKDLLTIGVSPSEFDIQTVTLSEENVLVASKSRDGQFILLPKAGDGNFLEVQSFIQKQISPSLE
jgi:anionic cell wall polymer biosynthesis LytR-Cps2A-Psr (LCP) family protein